MRRFAGLVMLTALLVVPLFAQDAPVAATAPVSPREADALAREAVDDLIWLNNTLADHFFHNGEWEKAVAVFDRVIELRTTDYDPYSSAAWLLTNLGRIDEAITYYNRMIEVAPENPEAHFEFGFFYYNRMKNYEEAAKWFKMAIDFGLKPPKSHIYGHTLVKLGRIEEAIAFWQSILADNPNNEVARRQIQELAKKLNPEPAVPAE